MTLTCLNKTEKPYKRKILKKAEKGDNQHRGKKINQDLETTRRSYATRRLKRLYFDWLAFLALNSTTLIIILLTIRYGCHKGEHGFSNGWLSFPVSTGW